MFNILINAGPLAGAGAVDIWENMKKTI